MNSIMLILKLSFICILVLLASCSKNLVEVNNVKIQSSKLERSNLLISGSVDITNNSILRATINDQDVGIYIGEEKVGDILISLPYVLRAKQKQTLAFTGSVEYLNLRKVRKMTNYMTIKGNVKGTALLFNFNEFFDYYHPVELSEILDGFEGEISDPEFIEKGRETFRRFMDVIDEFNKRYRNKKDGP